MQIYAILLVRGKKISRSTFELLNVYWTHRYTMIFQGRYYFLQFYLNDIQAHIDDMFSASAVVPGSRVAFKSVAKISTVQVMISQIIMTPPVER